MFWSWGPEVQFSPRNAASYVGLVVFWHVFVTSYGKLDFAVIRASVALNVLHHLPALRAIL